MGPRSDNRGYGPQKGLLRRLQLASMGPRSDNRGYSGPSKAYVANDQGFNGSAVG